MTTQAVTAPTAVALTARSRRLRLGATIALVVVFTLVLFLMGLTSFRALPAGPRLVACVVTVGAVGVLYLLAYVGANVVFSSARRRVLRDIHALKPEALTFASSRTTELVRDLDRHVPNAYLDWIFSVTADADGITVWRRGDSLRPAMVVDWSAVISIVPAVVHRTNASFVNTFLPTIGVAISVRFEDGAEAPLAFLPLAEGWKASRPKAPPEIDNLVKQLLNQQH
jgi:hypothetical protein